ncbi:MAG TPA: hypothetical protein VF838_01985 [Trebonia sp.]
MRVPDPLAAAELEAGAAAELDAGALEAGVLDDVALELHPATSSAATAAAAPPAAMRARLSLNMDFTRLLESKAFGRRVHRGFGWLIDQ